MNLIENALQVLAAGEPVRVQVSATASEAVVRVIDHGPGVPAEERERIFEPFQRGARTARPRRGARARDRARLRRGERRPVWVESRAGQGARSCSRCRSAGAPRCAA